MDKQTTNEDFGFNSLRIGLASPDKIREWSHGEVKKPETINYRTLKPEKEGLFCERIFGPTKDWECSCGKYKRIRHKGIICENCGVEVTKSSVRRERMGHIELAAPVSHIWYFKGIPSRMGLILEMSPRNLERVIYFASYIVLDPGETSLSYKQILSESELQQAREEFGEDAFEVGIGAEAIQRLLKEIDLDEQSEILKEELKSSSGQKKIRVARRLEAVEAFRNSKNKPEWMILEAIPVIPPELRPMVQLDGGRFATSDLNDLYRRVINRNNRLIKLLELDAPDIIIQNEKRMLQEAVDSLIDNGRRGRAITGPGNRAYKSLSDMLKGKQGRFRQNLLGKRVDYSGRSVIVVGPELKMYQCGLPKEMAIELFKPFVMHELVKRELAANIKSAKKLVEKLDPIIWDVLEDVIHEHPVLLNRAPTLHRLGIQAFEPVLIEGRAIKLHPLVCTAYNADFDGDQMAIHVPLSVEAQAEARFLMMACNNILKPQDGTPVVVPTQDMILGSYYMTLEKEGAKGEGSAYIDTDEMEMAYLNHDVELQARVKVRVTKEIDGVEKSRLVESTVGRFLFNQSIPQDIGIVKRETEEDMFKLEIDTVVDKKVLTQIVDRTFKKHGPTLTSEMLDEIKSKGYEFSTKSGITVGIADMQVPGDKDEILANADKRVEKNLRDYQMGLITEEERYKNVVEIWDDATQEVTNALLDHLEPTNPINMMAESGARGSTHQIRQLAGMRGLMTNPTGRIIELPIRSNFREGLDVLEFFSSTHGARKGLADTALRTADSGYLTRRLVDVAQEVIVREEDCGTTEGYEVRAILNGNEVIETLSDRLAGRYAFEDVIHPVTGEVMVEKDTIITSDMAQEIEDAGIESVMIRAVFNCQSEYGVCKKCYGIDMTTWNPVEIGEAVGTIAAQSIGEPGTQLTMRTFHTGGVASADDITQGLPRVEELFEARKPKGQAIMTEVAGQVEIVEDKKTEVIIHTDDGMERPYAIPYGSRLRVKNGDFVEAGEALTEGSLNPSDILYIKGISDVQAYLLSEVQKVYRLQGVHISDKHVELIIRQMLRKVKIEDAGDTNLITGATIDIFQYQRANEEAIKNGLKPAVGTRELLGITKASLATDSFLAAASFQETTRVLTDAAIKGKIDPLLGLKENVMIGKLIPAGTGVAAYEDVELNYDDADIEEAEIIAHEDEMNLNEAELSAIRIPDVIPLNTESSVGDMGDTGLEGEIQDSEEAVLSASKEAPSSSEVEDVLEVASELETTQSGQIEEGISSEDDLMQASIDEIFSTTEDEDNPDAQLEGFNVSDFLEKDEERPLKF